MGRTKKKGKGKIDFDELLEGTADPGWLTGVPAAMAMEEDAPAAAAAAAAVGEPEEVNMGGMSTPAPVADFVSLMDTGEVKTKHSQPQAKRGNRSTKQKLRKQALQEKASARAERVQTKAMKKQGKKAAKGVLKHVY